MDDTVVGRRYRPSQIDLQRRPFGGRLISFAACAIRSSGLRIDTGRQLVPHGAAEKWAALLPGGIEPLAQFDQQPQHIIPLSIASPRRGNDDCEADRIVTERIDGWLDHDVLDPPGRELFSSDYAWLLRRNAARDGPRISVRRCFLAQPRLFETERKAAGVTGGLTCAEFTCRHNNP